MAAEVLRSYRRRGRGPVFETSRVSHPQCPSLLLFSDLLHCYLALQAFLLGPCGILIDGIANISGQWIFHALAKELSLTVTLTFEKIEATAEDVIILLNTLWERADDISCQPRTRLCFYGTLLLGGIGGFRQATIRRLTYGDINLAVVRDPSD